jgi:hypothetical protein
MAIRIEIRHDTTENWAAANPILAAGEPALDETTGYLRYGNGVDHYLDLPAVGQLFAESAAASATAAAASADQAAESADSIDSLVSQSVTDALASLGAYIKPGTGIPSSDMTTAVQTSLGKADTALQSAPVSSVAGKTGAVALVKADVGLGNVDNTSDANKPVSTAQASAIAAKYTKPGTGIPSSDMATAVQTSLGKADTSVQSLPAATTSVSGIVELATTAETTTGTDTVRATTPAGVAAAIAAAGGGGGGAVTSVAGRTGAVVLTSADVGLGNVNNTADSAKPVSTAQAAAIALKADDSAAVHKTGAETIAGIKTFSSNPVFPAGSIIRSELDASTVASLGKADTALQSVAAATASAAGIVELATVAEATAGTDTTRAITAAGLAAAVVAGGGGGSGVSSVNGETGVVDLSAADVGAVPSVGSSNIVYTTDGTGVNTTTSISSSATNNSVAKRTGTGQLAITDATSSGQAASKGQMDTAIAAAVADLPTTGVSAVLSSSDTVPGGTANGLLVRLAS